MTEDEASIERHREHRLQLIEALIGLGERPQEVLELVLRSTDRDALTAEVAALLGSDLVGAQHVLDSPLRRLTPAGLAQLRAEAANLRQPYETREIPSPRPGVRTHGFLTSSLDIELEPLTSPRPDEEAGSETG